MFLRRSKDNSKGYLMKSLKNERLDPMRLGLLILLIFVAVAVVFCCRERRVQTYRDSKITAGEITRPFNTLAVHSSKLKYLTINGRTYTGIRGLPPYYLDVPELKCILFVTQENNYKVVFHFFDLVEKRDIQINADGAGFGWRIGSGKKPGDTGTDYIEEAQSNRVTVATRSLDWKETMILNLATKSVERWEGIYFDKNGQVTKRRVQTDETSK